MLKKFSEWVHREYGVDTAKRFQKKVPTDRPPSYRQLFSALDSALGGDRKDREGVRFGATTSPGANRLKFHGRIPRERP